MSLVVIVQNISQLAPISDYNYEVLVGDGTRARSKVLATGTIKRHDRAQDWTALVQKVVDDNV